MLPPEILGENTATSLPFKVDSWQLGLCVCNSLAIPVHEYLVLTVFLSQIFFILTDGVPFIRTSFGWSEYALDEYGERIESIKDPECVEMNELIPIELRDGFRPVLLALLQRDPAHRSSVQELLDYDWLMTEEDD